MVVAFGTGGTRNGNMAVYLPAIFRRFRVFALFLERAAKGKEKIQKNGQKVI
jgi:hypothetical protein